MSTCNLPPPPPTFPFLIFISTSFHSLFKKNLKILGWEGSLNPPELPLNPGYRNTYKKTFLVTYL